MLSLSPSPALPPPHLEAVHLGEDLVERLLALVVAARDARAALAADGVDLVDEDDARRRLLGLPARPARGSHAVRAGGPLGQLRHAVSRMCVNAHGMIDYPVRHGRMPNRLLLSTRTLRIDAFCSEDQKGSPGVRAAREGGEGAPGRRGHARATRPRRRTSPQTPTPRWRRRARPPAPPRTRPRPRLLVVCGLACTCGRVEV